MRSENADGEIRISFEDGDSRIFMSDTVEHGKCKQGSKFPRMKLQGYIREYMQPSIHKDGDTLIIRNSLTYRLRKREYTLDPLEQWREKIAR